ncbi:MAG: 3-methyl-2-oxobutanoate hydroxymethyltransferase [Chloroflexota bacterium]|nr:3-methyl-2-oxobutanoate hydroxymethyltransferase [Chloroflexota bacterium]
MTRISTLNVLKMKSDSSKFAMVTAYDYTSAQLADNAGIPILLVGDSLGMVVMGHDSTIPVTTDDIIRHTQMVVRGSQTSLIVSDLPFLTYQISRSQALSNAARLVQEGGCQSVKLEGGEHIAESVQAIVQSGIPVMGHLGLTPQHVHTLGGFRTQGRTQASAQNLINDALCLEQAGAYAVVLELVPLELAGLITERLNIPTIGIGAGPNCDGQVQVFHDLLGLFTDFTPKHSKQYAQLAQTTVDALTLFVSEVTAGAFPSEQHSSHLESSILEQLS